MHTQGLDSLPYDKRRLLVMVDNPSEWAVPNPSMTSKVLRHALRFSPFILGGVGGLAVVAYDEVRDRRLARRTASAKLVLKIDRVLATQLSFPPGHPRPEVVYAGHPVDWRTYVPMADIHRFLFEHKVAEAQRLLRSLGASRIVVEHIEGWDQSAGVSADVGIPTTATHVDVGASAHRQRAYGTQVMSVMELTPTGEPRVPEGLVWMSHEPLWQEVAEARVNSGLKSFTLDVRSTEDYGIDAKAKAALSGAGLDLGGEVREHKTTTWRLVGECGSENECGA